MSKKYCQISNSTPSILFWSGIAVLMMAIVVILELFFFDAFVWLGTEDKFGENMTSVFYIAAGILMLIAVGRNLKGNRTTILRAVLPILMAIFFIFVGGEEISWGQRIFGFETPETIQQNNVQDELTLHNLSFFDRGGAVLNQHTMLNILALTLGFLIPFAYRFMGWIRRLANWFGYPAQPLSLSLFFLLGLIHGQTLSRSIPHWANPEVKELIFSVGFFLFGLAYFQGTTWLASRREGQPETTSER